MDALKEFEKLQTDKERWIWLQKNQDKGLIVNLDNDNTFVTDGNDPEIDGYVNFDDYVGSISGVQELLSAMGIRSEPV